MIVYNLVNLWGILVRSMIVIVSWAIENNLVYLRCYSGWAYDSECFFGY